MLIRIPRWPFLFLLVFVQLHHLPDNSADVIAHWRAEWRHAHDDHDLCRPHYLFGCTEIEQLQFRQLQQHQAGEHGECPKEFPVYMLKPTVEFDTTGEMVDELSQEMKESWRAHWRHEHGDHETCKSVTDLKEKADE